MKIVIVGAGGMLAQALKDVFSSEEVVALGKDQADITNFEGLLEAVGPIKPQVILNAAAYTDVDGAEEEKELAFKVNDLGVGNLAKVAAELGATLVHYSTDYVFPGDREGGYKEDDRPGPAVNVYGESKLKGEESLRSTGGSYYILRTAWLYGEGGNNFVKTMLRLAEEKKELRVVNDQHGSPTYTKDVAEAMKQLVMGEYGHGVYHAVNEGVTTWYGLAKEIFRVVGADVTVVPVGSDEYPRPAARPKYSVLLNTKGLEMRSWQEALGDFLGLEL
jgi:dTDP-4-dehydrorhamnose reductase